MQVLQWLGSLLVGVISVSVIAFSIINVEEVHVHFNSQNEKPTEHEKPPVQVINHIHLGSETAAVPSTSESGTGDEVERFDHLAPQRHRVPSAAVDCEGKTTYECQRLQEMQAMARLSEQHRTEVSRQSISVNDQMVQDVIHTRSQGVVRDMAEEGQWVEGTVH